MMGGQMRLCGLLVLLLSSSCCEAFSTGGLGGGLSARGLRVAPPRGHGDGGALVCSMRSGRAASLSVQSRGGISQPASRRALLAGFLALDVFLGMPTKTQAVYIDSDGVMKSGRRPQDETVNVKMGDDEFEVRFGKGPVGLDFEERLFPADAPREKQKSRLEVTGLKPGSQAQKLRAKEPRLQPGVVVVSVEGVNIEGMRGKTALGVLKESKASVEKEGYKLRVLFRDAK